jgi:hypothetical protein
LSGTCKEREWSVEVSTDEALGHGWRYVVPLRMVARAQDAT